MSKKKINILLEASEDFKKKTREKNPRFIMFGGPNKPFEDLIKNKGGELLKTVHNGDGTTCLTYKL